MSGRVRVAVIADTHVPRRAHDLPATAWRHIEQAGVLIHAGDITAPAFLGRLQRGVRRLIVVRGNNDHELSDLGERADATLGGVPMAVVHDAAAPTGRRTRLRAMFPHARVIVFGHSHIPVLDDDGDLLLLNPGSPTDRRRMPSFTMASLTLHAGVIEEARIVDLGLERAPRAQSV